MEIYELTPKDSHKSFYGKALVICNKGVKYLRSYNTIVASIQPDGTIKRHWDDWSATTGRHLLSFCGICKKEWEKMPVESVDVNF